MLRYIYVWLYVWVYGFLIFLLQGATFKFVQKGIFILHFVISFSFSSSFFAAIVRFCCSFSLLLAIWIRSDCCNYFQINFYTQRTVKGNWSTGSFHVQFSLLFQFKFHCNLCRMNFTLFYELQSVCLQIFNEFILILFH